MTARIAPVMRRHGHKPVRSKFESSEEVCILQKYWNEKSASREELMTDVATFIFAHASDDLAEITARVRYVGNRKETTYHATSGDDGAEFSIEESYFYGRTEVRWMYCENGNPIRKCFEEPRIISDNAN